VTVLTTSYWPSYKTFADLQVPRELDPGMQSFSQYYSAKHNHRQIKWCYSLGSATVSAKFPQTGKTYDCVVGTFQMCIIMLFNNPKRFDGSFTVKEIREMMKMDEDTCLKNLKSLMLKNFKLLEVRQNSGDAAGKMTPGMQNPVLKDDSFIGVNEAFSSQLIRIVFPTPVLEEVYKKGRFCFFTILL